MTNVPPEGPPEDPRDALIREQAERIAALEAVVTDLREQLAAAERAGSRNSGNSSMQPGSPGAAMRWEVPARTEVHFPEGACSCGRDLADAADLGVTRSRRRAE